MVLMFVLFLIFLSDKTTNKRVSIAKTKDTKRTHFTLWFYMLRWIHYNLLSFDDEVKIKVFIAVRYLYQVFFICDECNRYGI